MGRRPRRILGLWARLTLLGLSIGVLALAIFGLVTKAVRPYREEVTQNRQMTVTRRQIADVDRQNADLRRRIAYLQTDEGKTTEARNMGFVKPGEIPFVVEGPTVPTTAPSTAFSLTPPAPDRGSQSRRPWQGLMTGH